MESPIFIKEKSVGSPIIEESLISMEEMDRTSPELWPDQVPEVSEYMNSFSAFVRPAQWTGDLDSDDINFMLYLSKMTPAGLIAEVKKLYDSAYQLGVEEAKEMTRGKILKILATLNSN